MSCSRNWHGLFNEKLRQRLTECLDRNARPEPICVDVIVKDWNKTRSVGTYLGEHREDTDFEERPTHGEPIKEVHRWRKRRREKEEGVGRASIIPATDVFAQRFAHVQHGPTFERFEWKSEVLWQMIEAVQGSIRELEMMQSNSDGSTKIGCRYGVVRGDEQYNNVGAPMTTKLVAVYLDNSCLYQIVCASIVAMGYAFVPLHRQWPSRIISEVVEACGAMTVFWSRPTSYHGDGHSKTASRDVPGGLGLPTCAELLPDERSKSPKQIWYSELKCSHASSGELSVSIEHTCRHGAEERDSQMMQHAEVLQRRSPGFSSASEIVSTAYIMRTSGTTQGHASQGKYVVGTIRGILNRIKWFEMEHPSSVGKSLTTDRDVLAFLTPNCFVDHVWQTFASLCSDIQTIAIPLGLYMDDYLLLLAIKEFRISHLVLTPSKWQRLVNARCSVHDAFGSIKVAISSGELLSTHLLKQLKSALHPRCKIMNIYGSTEVSADATCFECSDFYTLEDHLCGAHGWVPVGKPICNTIVSLSMQFKTNDRLGDEYLQSISPGKKQVGMIWCGGIGVCNGYLDLSNDTEMVRSKFAMFRDFGELQAHFDYTIKDNRLDFPAKRSQTPEESSIWMFCMGDLGFIDDSGDLVVIGRADMTTKVGGHFIQIEEIENLLENIEGIVRAFATVVEIEGRSVVAACIVQNDGSNLSESQIQCMCRQRVDMMNFIPEYIFELENLPLTCSGKLDRKLLQKIAMEKVEKQRKLHSTGRVDAILTESEVHAIVAKCLHIVAFEPTESLFDLGANSIAIQKIASRLNLSPNQVIDHPTVRRLTKVRENRVALPGQINRQQGSDVNFSRQMKIPLLWKFVSDSCIDVPPCVLGSTVFCCSHKGLVAALHVEDGHVLWTTSLNSTIAGKLGASGSLLVVPRETEIVCLNESNGNILWKKSGLCVAGQSGAYFDEHENIWIGTHNLGLVVLSASTGANQLFCLIL